MYPLLPFPRPIICLTALNEQMGGAMADLVVADIADVSVARLHGHACWDCGAVDDELISAGEAIVAGFSVPWPIVKCSRHAESGSGR
ncbi:MULTISPECIES: hypothetical protein [unclassified Streptomyces]|uniref:hypothetical protein n=1 Tax=unclassified Streptomyces TaxID=2593676 RepID=UPI0013A6B321|nr:MULTISPECIES: hypothetical protein [unclassified Streptomyces]